MKRLWAICVVVLCLVFVVGQWNPSEAQDRTGDRLDALETRVAELETQVAILATPGSVQSGAVRGAAVDETYTITGEFSLFGSRDSYSLSSSGCYGDGGYDDIYPGAQVRATDGDGNLLAIAELEDDPNSTRCDFVFTLEVPESAFYMISAGAARRSGPIYTFQEMEDADWEVSLSMG